MIIDTEKYVRLADGIRESGVPAKTGYRVAGRLGIIVEAFGVKLIAKKDIPKLSENRKRVGNPEWIESYEIASAAAHRAVASRMRRKRSKNESA